MRYHEMYMTIMPQCRKPKLHYLHHTPQQLRVHQRNLSCFGPERRHKKNKQALNYIYRHMEVALVVRNALFANLATRWVGWRGLRPFFAALLHPDRFEGVPSGEPEMGVGIHQS